MQAALREHTSTAKHTVNVVDMAYDLKNKAKPLVSRAVSSLHKLSKKTRKSSRDIETDTKTTIEKIKTRLIKPVVARSPSVEELAEDDECHVDLHQSAQTIVFDHPITAIDTLTIIDNVAPNTSANQCRSLVIAPRSDIEACKLHLSTVISAIEIRNQDVQELRCQVATLTAAKHREQQSKHRSQVALDKMTNKYNKLVDTYNKGVELFGMSQIQHNAAIKEHLSTINAVHTNNEDLHNSAKFLEQHRNTLAVELYNLNIAHRSVIIERDNFAASAYEQKDENDKMVDKYNALLGDYQQQEEELKGANTTASHWASEYDGQAIAINDLKETVAGQAAEIEELKKRLEAAATMTSSSSGSAHSRNASGSSSNTTMSSHDEIECEQQKTGDGENFAFQYKAPEGENPFLQTHAADDGFSTPSNFDFGQVSTFGGFGEMKVEDGPSTSTPLFDFGPKVDFGCPPTETTSFFTFGKSKNVSTPINVDDSATTAAPVFNFSEQLDFNPPSSYEAEENEFNFNEAVEAPSINTEIENESAKQARIFSFSAPTIVSPAMKTEDDAAASKVDFNFGTAVNFTPTEPRVENKTKQPSPSFSFGTPVDFSSAKPKIEHKTSKQSPSFSFGAPIDFSSSPTKAEKEALTPAPLFSFGKPKETTATESTVEPQMRTPLGEIENTTPKVLKRKPVEARIVAGVRRSNSSRVKKN